MSPAKYIQHCDMRLNAEETRFDTILVSTTSSATVKKQLLTIVQDNLFTNHAREILDSGMTPLIFLPNDQYLIYLSSGLASLIESQDYGTLRQLMLFFNRTESLNTFCDGFKSYIEVRLFLFLLYVNLCLQNSFSVI